MFLQFLGLPSNCFKMQWLNGAVETAKNAMMILPKASEWTLSLQQFVQVLSDWHNSDTTYTDFAWIAYFLQSCHNWRGLCLWFVALQQKYTDCLRICGRRTWGPSTLCLFLQRPTVFITIVWMSLQFKRSWLRSPRISQSSCNPDNRNTILFRAAIPFQLNIVVSTLQVSVAWGGKIFGLNAICPNRSRISNFPQLSCNPLESARITWNPPELCLDWKSHTILKWSMGSRFAICPNWVGWVCSFVWWPRTVAGWGQSRRNQTRLA